MVCSESNVSQHEEKLKISYRQLEDWLNIEDMLKMYSRIHKCHKQTDGWTEVFTELLSDS